MSNEEIKQRGRIEIFANTEFILSQTRAGYNILQIFNDLKAQNKLKISRDTFYRQVKKLISPNSVLNKSEQITPPAPARKESTTNSLAGKVVGSLPAQTSQINQFNGGVVLGGNDPNFLDGLTKKIPGDSAFAQKQA